MGGPMAGHLVVGCHDVRVHNRTKARADALVAKGAQWAGTPAEASRGRDVVFLCVSDTPDVEQVLFGTDGVAAGAAPNTIVVDHSTISPASTREFARRLAAQGVTLLDAPVSGGDVGARNATLSIAVGGPTTAFEKVLPLLGLLGKTITHVGESGSGQLTKCVNQILVAVNNMAVCEALNFAVRSGLDPVKTLAVVGGGAAGSWQLTNLGPRMLAGDYKPGFTIDLQQKDLRLVAEMARDSKTPLLATALVQQLFTMAQSHGLGAQSTHALYEAVKGLSAVPSR